MPNIKELSNKGFSRRANSMISEGLSWTPCVIDAGRDAPAQEGKRNPRTGRQNGIGIRFHGRDRRRRRLYRER